MGESTEWQTELDMREDRVANRTQWGIKFDGKVGNRAQQKKDGIYNSMENKT